MNTSKMPTPYECGGCQSFTSCKEHKICYNWVRDNPHLIASAPDLLAALEESLALNLNWVSTAEPEHLQHLSEYRAVIEQARATIAKAKGETK